MARARNGNISEKFEQDILSECKKQETLDKARKEKRKEQLNMALTKRLRPLINEIQEEALFYAETKSAEILEQSLCNLKKIGKIIEICLSLCPENVKASCRETIGSDLVSNLFVCAFHQRRKKSLFYARIYSIYSSLYKNDELKLHDKFLDAKNTNYFNDLIIPSSIVYSYCNNLPNKYEINKQINELSKKNLYTSALLLIVNHLSSEKFLIHFYDYRSLYFIGDLLLDMRASDSCFELYSVDSRIFQNPKSLGLLVDAAIKAGNLEKSQELLTKLIDSEPYHPSIPILKSEIKRLENRSALRVNFSIDFSKINELSGIEFEKLLYDKFSELGFKVESTPKTGDFGADLIIEDKEGTRIVVQCKRFTSKVNLKAVQEVNGAIGYYGCDIGIVITNNSFLNSAVKLAESHDIELWDGDKLVSFLAGDLTFSKIIGD